MITDAHWSQSNAFVKSSVRRGKRDQRPDVMPVGVPRERKPNGRFVGRNCAPDCALTGVYPRQTPPLTGRHEERPSGGQVVETTAENVSRYVSTLFQRSAFQACSLNHSDISPFRINHLRTCDRAESDLCPDCALTLSTSPHILTGWAITALSAAASSPPEAPRPGRDPVRTVEGLRVNMAGTD
jgi:hypothetical protein